VTGVQTCALPILPEAGGKIVFDKFHIAKHLGEAVDRVRRRENKTLRAAGDDRLAGTRYDWLRNPAAMEPKDRREFAELRKSELKTARAWALKEAAMALFSYVYERPARKHFRWWHGWAVRSRLQPMIETARMLKRRLENVLTYLRHRITNAASESINSKIQWVKYTARGFRNKKNFQVAIYFHCGGLDMAPSCHQKAGRAHFLNWGQRPQFKKCIAKQPHGRLPRFCSNSAGGT
jgi:transposase